MTGSLCTPRHRNPQIPLRRLHPHHHLHFLFLSLSFYFDLIYFIFLLILVLVLLPPSAMSPHLLTQENVRGRESNATPERLKVSSRRNGVRFRKVLFSAPFAARDTALSELNSSKSWKSFEIRKARLAKLRTASATVFEHYQYPHNFSFMLVLSLFSLNIHFIF